MVQCANDISFTNASIVVMGFRNKVRSTGRVTWATIGVSLLIAVSASSRIGLGYIASVLGCIVYFVGTVGCVAAFLLFFRRALEERRPARLFGGNSIRDILKKVPILSDGSAWAPMNLCGTLQLVLLGVIMNRNEQRFDAMYEFETQEVEVKLPGKSAMGFSDTVSLCWILGRRDSSRRQLAPDAPIILLCPGLNCYAAGLPDTSIYEHLLARPWRIGVFHKRGVGQGTEPSIRGPCFHLFGHPSDLHIAIQSVAKRWPEASLHLVGMSSGNGLVGSYVSFYGPESPSLRSCLLLIGGEDYNEAFRPANGTWESQFIFNYPLLSTTQERFLKRNWSVLCPPGDDEKKEAYEAAVTASTLQDLYDITMRYFSGYSDPEEAESRINAFSGGNECLLKNKIPFLCVYTEDDPVAPGGPKQSWIDVIERCDHSAIALMPNGSHLACFDGWNLSKWVDRLAVQWLDAQIS